MDLRIWTNYHTTATFSYLSKCFDSIATGCFDEFMTGWKGLGRCLPGAGLVQGVEVWIHVPRIFLASA
jgi:hypothetical protein